MNVFTPKSPFCTELMNLTHVKNSFYLLLNIICAAFGNGSFFRFIALSARKKMTCFKS